MDDPKVVVTVNGEPIYQKEVDTVVNQSPNIKISESEVITNSINQLVVVQYGKKNGCSASQEEIDQQLNEYENSYPTIYDSALDLFGEDGLRKGIEYRIIYEKKGYTFIGRYLNHSAGVRNGLTVSEANRLSNAGVFICALYESDSGTSISHFTRSNGIADAREAISLAEDLGMPTGNPIYFCIDTDVTKSQMTTYIVPYVQGILSELEGSGYKLGIYGPKPVCKYIRGTYSATERYMMICDNDWGQSGWSATERDFDDWNIRQYEWNQSLPGVSSVTIDKCESSTNGGGGWKL